MAGKWKLLVQSTLVVLMAVAAQSAGATIVDLTSTGTSGTINGAIFEQIDPQSTGTGVIDSFVRIQATGTEEGYNTTQNGVFDNTSDDTHNRTITLGDVPVVDIGGTLYRQFLLDVNEVSGNGGDYISLDQVLIFMDGAANSNSTDLSSGGPLGTIVYDMDGAGNNTVALNYALNAGSGSGDMYMYVLNSAFSGYQNSDNLTLYSHFGADLGVDPAGLPSGDYGTSDGFEEWAVLRSETVVPEPTTLSLMGLGLAGLFLRRAKRSKA